MLQNRAYNGLLLTQATPQMCKRKSYIGIIA